MQLKFGGLLLKQVDKILILKKRVMRLMSFNDVFPSTPGPLSSTDPIFVKLNCMNIEDIYKYQVSNLFLSV